jgi:hypothetical protein
MHLTTEPQNIRSKTDRIGGGTKLETSIPLFKDS